MWRLTARELSMAHIHLPYGAFSIQFLIFCWILVAVLVTTALLLARRQIINAERLSITAMVAAASFAIFHVDVPFVSGDLAHYNAHAGRVRQ
jgi:ABC-type Co2+ transport system permease subunit